MLLCSHNKILHYFFQLSYLFNHNIVVSPPPPPPILNSWKSRSEKILFCLCCLRNRFLLTWFVAQYITGWKAVVKWIYHNHEARVMYSLTTDQQQVVYWATNHLLARLVLILTPRKRWKGKCILRCFQFFTIAWKEIPPKLLTAIEALSCIS